MRAVLAGGILPQTATAARVADRRARGARVSVRGIRIMAFLAGLRLDRREAGYSGSKTSSRKASASSRERHRTPRAVRLTDPARDWAHERDLRRPRAEAATVAVSSAATSCPG